MFSFQLRISIIADLRRGSSYGIRLFAREVCYRPRRRCRVIIRPTPRIKSNYSRINLNFPFIAFISANVLARFGLKHPSRCLGLVLINCTGSAATVLETFKTKFISWKEDEVGQGAEDFLLYHKFGHVSRLRSSYCNHANFSLSVGFRFNNFLLLIEENVSMKNSFRFSSISTSVSQLIAAR